MCYIKGIFLLLMKESDSVFESVGIRNTTGTKDILKYLQMMVIILLLLVQFT